MESWPRRAFLFWSACRCFILSHWAGRSLCPCRQKLHVNRISSPISAIGTKRTFRPRPRLSAFGPKRTKLDFGSRWFCPLMTQSGNHGPFDRVPWLISGSRHGSAVLSSTVPIESRYYRCVIIGTHRSLMCWPHKTRFRRRSVCIGSTNINI